MKIIKRGLFIAALSVILFALSFSAGYSLERLPDVGIDYRTMTVSQATKIIAAGMKEARNGDKILMRVDEKGVRYFKNLRTNEEMAYPPAAKDVNKS